MVVDVTHNIESGLTALVATHPVGSAGAVTPSKFSLPETVEIGVPLRKVNWTVPRLVAPSCNWNVAVSVWPHVVAEP